ncbi:MAG: TonB family protein [Candidatus Zixiibacteriota bacterium]
MASNESALYSPYGAYELKAKYQRNFMFGTLATTTFILLILVVAWLIQQMGGEEAINTEPVRITTVADLGPPPTLAKKPPQVQVNQPNVAAPKVGIPTPVADDEVMDEDVVLATREEMADIVAPDIVSDGSSQDIVVDIAEEDYLPSMDEFVPVEVPAEMIYEEMPEYPRLAKDAGLEGRVWIKALVGKDGSVKDAAVYKSSGTPLLDDAALKSAPKNKFKPAIQNGRPVAMWVTYKVDFVIKQ